MTPIGQVRQPRRAHELCVVVTFGILALGCSAGGILPPVEAVTVTLESGEKLPGMSPATLTVFSDRSWTFTISASNGAVAWSLVAALTELQAGAGTLHIPVVMGPVPDAGEASVRSMTGEAASSGTVTLERSRGRVQGAVDVDVPALSATFAGVYAVSCWVPRSTVDAAISSSGGDADPDIEDKTLSAPGCSAYRALLQ